MLGFSPVSEKIMFEKKIIYCGVLFSKGIITLCYHPHKASLTTPTRFPTHTDTPPSNLIHSYPHPHPSIPTETRFFAIFSSLIHYFLEIEYSDSLQQCLTSSRGKIQKKKFGTKFGPKRTKIGPKIRFLPFFQFDLLVFL